MQCRWCQHENQAAARFCGGRGQALLVHCAACGFPNSPGYSFCDDCAMPLPDALSPHQAQRSTAVRAYTPAHLRLQRIALSPLSEEHSAVLVANLVGSMEMPPALHAQILRQTEDNPFFIGEVIRSLVTDGVLTRGTRSTTSGILGFRKGVGRGPALRADAETLIQT